MSKKEEGLNMVLSDQAVGALMLALQDSLMHQSDIVPVLKKWVLLNSDEGIIVLNPPQIKVDEK